MPITGINDRHVVHLTALEWAAETSNPELAELFISRGADANFNTHPKEGHAMVRAVKRWHHTLISRLLPYHFHPCSLLRGRTA